MATDIFADLLDLEQQFYDDGFQQGIEDGKSAGQREGRTFGLERGFERYAECGRLYGRSLVWANQMALAQISTSEDCQENRHAQLRPLPRRRRLSQHLKVLHALVEPETLPIQNTDKSVSYFEDRLKRARAKATMIEQLIGERNTKNQSTEVQVNIEDLNFPNPSTSKFVT